MKKIRENVGRFIDKNYKKVQVVLLSIMTMCLFNITIGVSQYMTEEKVRKEMQTEKEIAIAEMQIQTEVLLNENGYEWNGTKVVEISK